MSLHVSQGLLGHSVNDLADSCCAFLFDYDLLSSYRGYNILPKKELRLSLWVNGSQQN